MFGYIKPFKPDLRLSEYETYKAVYCGLCHRLGQVFGPFARMTLSYDFTFLALLGMALSTEEPTFSQQRCFANPLKKCTVECGSPALDFAADCAMILLYYKVQDNRQDSGPAGKTAALLAHPFAKGARDKAALRLAQVDGLVAQAMEQQAALEAAGCPSVDQASEPSARSLSGICALLSEDGAQQRILERLGYLIGRFVYLCDALDDLEEDQRQGSYNPFLAGREGTLSPQDATLLRENAKGSLYLTIGEIGKTYQLLDLNRYDSILSNVIYMGMKSTVNQILYKKELASDERPL